MKLVFDIETSMKSKEDPSWSKSVFFKNVTKVVCICAIDLLTGKKYTFHDNPEIESNGSNIQGIEFLLNADILIGHNIKGFDIPAILTLHPEYAMDFIKQAKFDTLVVARELFTWKELADYDRKHNIQHSDYNARALNSLGAWGDRFRDRLGLSDLAKDEEFKDKVDWTNPTVDEELLGYCMQDVVVNAQVYKTEVKTFKHREKEAKDG